MIQIKALIPVMTFQTCVNLQSVEYRGDVITSIGANAFNGCRSLWELSIPGGAGVHRLVGLPEQLAGGVLRRKPRGVGAGRDQFHQ